MKLDRLESKIEELKMLYEQHFIDVLPHPPDKKHKEVKAMIRQLLKAPFKTSASRFRLRHLITRFQTYQTYWERVNKQREEGTYSRDVFKAELRERIAEEEKEEMKKSNLADKSMRQLYTSYETALKKSGSSTDNLNYDSFKRSLIKRAKKLKKEKGVTKLNYRIVMKNGKVTVKASGEKKGSK